MNLHGKVDSDKVHRQRERETLRDEVGAKGDAEELALSRGSHTTPTSSPSLASVVTRILATLCDSDVMMLLCKTRGRAMAMKEVAVL